MCYGRWDTRDHVIVDNCHLSLKWPGKDYINPNRKSLEKPELPFREHIDRLELFKLNLTCSSRSLHALSLQLLVFFFVHCLTTIAYFFRTHIPRMGWHDIAVCVDGNAARDVAYNFMQRWNHHKDFNHETSYPYLHPALLTSLPALSQPTLTAGTITAAVFGRQRMPLVPAHIVSTPVRCQVIRSICEWSGGNGNNSGGGSDSNSSSGGCENSIHAAYLHLIENAEHFIYIENQYFISSLGGGGIENRVAEAIYNRIARAIMHQEVFRVIVILPTIPDGIYEENAAIRYIMKWYVCTALLHAQHSPHRPTPTRNTPVQAIWYNLPWWPVNY